MNDLERQLQYPFGDAWPASGAAIEVAPGVRWIRMALPFALNHINLWLLRDQFEGRDGWTVVDCCIAVDDARAQWEQVFAESLDGLPILRVLVTHMHPDHVGLAHWLCERWNAPLWMSATDYNAARIGSQSATSFGGESAAQFFASHGLTDPQALQQVAGRKQYYSNLVPAVPPRFRRLMDGDTVRIGAHDWRCISGYGHAPEHMALACEALAVLISGDMVLPRISTNVSVFDIEPESNPLTLFLQSIDKFLPLAERTLVLPSHGRPFRGLQTRVGQLHDHHRARLAEVMVACAQRACSAADILPVMFPRELDLHQTTFAMGESLAHLHALWYSGELSRRRGDDGVWRFAVRT